MAGLSICPPTFFVDRCPGALAARGRQRKVEATGAKSMRQVLMKNAPSLNHKGLIRITSRMGGFGATALLSGLINVATIPVVVASVGANAWASIAAGQAVGIIGSILIHLGWGITGPAEIAATANDLARKHIYRESIAFRAVIVPPILVLVSFICWNIVPPAYSIAAAVAGIGSALLGLTAAWYFVGKGDPVGLMKLDTLPRILPTVAGAALLLIYPHEIVFSLAIVVSSIMPLLMASRAISVGAKGSSYVSYLTMARARKLLHSHASGLVASIVSQAYRYLPLILVTAIRPDQAVAYALIDRIIKFAEAAVKPLSQGLQSWIPTAGPSYLTSRVRNAMRVASLGGLAAFLFFLLLGPFASSILGNDSIEISANQYLPAALAIGLTVVTQMGMLGLLALGHRSSVALSVCVGGGLGLGILWPAVTWTGATGGLYCLVLAEAAVLVFQVAVLRRDFTVRRRRRT
ncbi:hypothetical protein [Arthrobacter sp. zg-Y238]|uniref:hypothetical protein n=1 Tax=Arthrobacter sp. zg-Y238 TaxID=2964614 RepID=UPI002106F561|nr:hypothetical protein [Arthrobacter sp. zg-Y238]MCQ1954394.1 hypothetical protein [Arthrobacter sp. zg-Y238]